MSAMSSVVGVAQRQLIHTTITLRPLTNHFTADDQVTTMKSSTAIFASLFGIAAAFAPTNTGSDARQTTTSLNNDLWGAPSDGDKEMSKALPFVARPKLLDGTMAGDAGFE